MFADELRKLTEKSKEERTASLVEKEVEVIKTKAGNAARYGKNFTWTKLEYFRDAVLPELKKLGFTVVEDEDHWVFLEW